MHGSHLAVSWHRAAAELFVVGLIGCTSSTELIDEPRPKDELRLEAVTETSLTGIVRSEVNPAPTVRVSNQAGRPVAGIDVVFELTSGADIQKAFDKTNSDGIATVGWWILGTRVGAYTVTARSGPMTVAFHATAEAGPVAQISPISGDNQSGLAGARLAEPLRVLVSDSYGNPVPHAPMTFTVISGSGSVDGRPVLTDSLGIATAAWTLGPDAGLQQVRAQAEVAQTVFTVFAALACDETCPELELAFVRRGQIFLTDLAGAVIRPLTSWGGTDASPAWSPDGRRIAFVRYTDHGIGIVGDLYVMNADGSNVVRRASGFDVATAGGGDPLGFRSPAWSPDGRTLAVDHGNCVYDCNIYLLSADDDGSRPMHLAGLATQPTWSPDGQKIAFVSLSGDDGYHALHVINRDGSQNTPITVRDAGGIFYPAWSPDGRRIAFAKCISGGCNIVAVNADGSGSVQLTTGVVAFEPEWSPDGTRIAFALWHDSNGGGTVSIAYVFADRGGSPISIVARGQSPAWRPRSPNE